jgi:hypothetical protein
MVYTAVSGAHALSPIEQAMPAFGSMSCLCLCLSQLLLSALAGDKPADALEAMGA